MNLVTAAKMLALLEQTPHDGLEDDAYFIIHRLLKTEIRKGEDESVLLEARREFLHATREEILVWVGNKVQAMRMYRERTGSGLYEAKMQLEAGERQLNSKLEPEQANVEATSCG